MGTMLKGVRCELSEGVDIWRFRGKGSPSIKY